MADEGGIGDVAMKVAIIAAGVALAKAAEGAVSFAIGGKTKDSGGKKGGKKRRAPAKKS